jgi:hypothetical protein
MVWTLVAFLPPWVRCQLDARLVATPAWAAIRSATEKA